MKTYLTVVFAGAVLTSAVFAADTRTPSTHKEACTKQECCHEHTAAQKQIKANADSTRTQSHFDAWSRAKWGRNIRTTNDREGVALAQTSPAGACDHPKCCD